MTVPRILFVVPGLLAGLLIPALGHAPKPLPTGDVGMVSDDFARDAVTIHVGERLTLFNNSNLIHVIGPGRGGRIWRTERHVPVLGFHLMQTNGVYQTPPWTHAGHLLPHLLGAPGHDHQGHRHPLAFLATAASTPKRR